MALQLFSKKAPQRLAYFFLELGRIGAGFPVYGAQGFENYFFGGLQNFFALLRAHEAARDKIRSGDNFARLLMDRHYDQHHAVFR
jgi:hypothetical protein